MLYEENENCIQVNRCRQYSQKMVNIFRFFFPPHFPTQQNASDKQRQMCGVVMETCAVNHPTGCGIVRVIQQVRFVWFLLEYLLKYCIVQGVYRFVCVQSLPSLPHLESGDIWRRGWNGGRRGLVFHNAGSVDADFPQDSSLVIYARALESVPRQFLNLFEPFFFCFFLSKMVSVYGTDFVMFRGIDQKGCLFFWGGVMTYVFWPHVSTIEDVGSIFILKA